MLRYDNMSSYFMDVLFDMFLATVITLILRSLTTDLFLMVSVGFIIGMNHFLRFVITAVIDAVKELRLNLS